MVRDIVVAQLEDAERAASEITTATEKLVDFLRRYWDRIRGPQFGPLFRLVHAEIHNFPDLARFYGEEVVSRHKRLIAGIIQGGIESGEFRPIDPLVAARMLSAPFVMHGLWCQHREAFSDLGDKTDDQILDDMIQFCLYAITPRSSARSNEK
jgi:hypothetical protein